MHQGFRGLRGHVPDPAAWVRPGENVDFVVEFHQAVSPSALPKVTDRNASGTPEQWKR